MLLMEHSKDLLDKTTNLKKKNLRADWLKGHLEKRSDIIFFNAVFFLTVWELTRRKMI